MIRLYIFFYFLLVSKKFLAVNKIVFKSLKNFLNKKTKNFFGKLSWYVTQAGIIYIKIKLEIMLTIDPHLN